MTVVKSSARIANTAVHRIPTRASLAVFRAKAAGLQLRRALRDKRDGLRRFPRADVRDFPCIWSQSRTPLWSDEALAERAMQTGKVQNLRQAIRQLNCAIPACETWSFWKQIGQATRRRGFVAGRLLREGCLMPAVGGGLCQLSNALYDAALQANLQIIERHAHSQIVPGSAAQNNRDATVAWNYVDLRFRAEEIFFIEAILTSDELIVRVRGQMPLPDKPLSQKSLRGNLEFSAYNPPPVARGVLDVAAHSCASCAQTTCVLHAPPVPRTTEKTAWIVDAVWPEFQELLTQNFVAHDELLVPLDGAKWKQARYSWSTPHTARIQTATASAWMRSFSARQNSQTGAEYLQAQIKNSAMIAGVLAQRIPYDATHLIVAQSFLPFLWRAGILGGRSFEVLMTRLPLHILHARLDEALAVHPERSTLGEYRAPTDLVESEKQALAAASRLISPHREITALFPCERVVGLPWNLPPAAVSFTENSQSRCIGFVGPTAARKGAYELREVARALDLEIALRGAEIEGETFWDGVRTRRVKSTEEFLAHAAVVVQPALVEENPRLLLSALARGIPVIATCACGLGERPGVLPIPFGDVAALQSAIETIIGLPVIDLAAPRANPQIHVEN